jgi:hypothetical protein
VEGLLKALQDKSPASLNVQAANLANYTTTFDSTHPLRNFGTCYGIATPNGSYVSLSDTSGYSKVASDFKSIRAVGSHFFNIGFFYSSSGVNPYFRIAIIQSVTLYYTMPSASEGSNLGIDFRATAAGNAIAQNVPQAVIWTTYTLDSTVSTTYYGEGATTGRGSLYFAVVNGGIANTLSCAITGITIAYKC